MANPKDTVKLQRANINLNTSAIAVTKSFDQLTVTPNGGDFTRYNYDPGTIVIMNMANAAKLKAALDKIGVAATKIPWGYGIKARVALSQADRAAILGPLKKENNLPFLPFIDLEKIKVARTSQNKNLTWDFVTFNQDNWKLLIQGFERLRIPTVRTMPGQSSCTRFQITDATLADIDKRAAGEEPEEQDPEHAVEPPIQTREQQLDTFKKVWMLVRDAVDFTLENYPPPFRAVPGMGTKQPPTDAEAAATNRRTTRAAIFGGGFG